MNKEQQIEEMAKFIHYKAHGKDKDCDNGKCKMCWCSCKNDAELLYNAGYHKVPKDSVVLSREEQERILTATEKRIKELKKQILQARKETAKEIIQLLSPECKHCDENWHEGCLCLRATVAEKIAKQYGVENKK